MKKTIIWIIALFLFLAFFVFASCEAKNAPAAADPVSETPTTSEETVSEEIYVYLNGNRLALSLADNSSARALAELLKDKDLSYEADDFGGFEKVGDLGIRSRETTSLFIRKAAT